MYKIEFYESQNGSSDVWDFLETLRRKGNSSKDARIQYNQIVFYIDLLSKNGTNISTMQKAVTYSFIISVRNPRKRRNEK